MLKKNRLGTMFGPFGGHMQPRIKPAIPLGMDIADSRTVPDLRASIH